MIGCHGKIRLMLVEHQLKRVKRVNRMRAATAVSALTAVAPDRSTEESRLVGQELI